ncbi:hypothetical protein MRX96_037468 [Rhipicephalus microplus]
MFASAFPLGVSKELVVQSLKQQNFTSLYLLLEHHLSGDGLRSLSTASPWPFSRGCRDLFVRPQTTSNT